MQRIYIEQADNGFIVEVTDNENGDVKHVFEAVGDNQHNPYPEMIGMLRFLVDYYGRSGSKHDAARIKIGYEAGDNYVDNQELALQIDPQLFDRT